MTKTFALLITMVVANPTHAHEAMDLSGISHMFAHATDSFGLVAAVLAIAAVAILIAARKIGGAPSRVRSSR